MTNGTVKFFNAAKGFGFITPDGDGKDVFVPATSVTASGFAGLKPGQRVSFEAEPDSKGPKAVQLKLLSNPQPPPPRPAAVPDRPAPARPVAPPRMTVLLDPVRDESDDVLDALRDAGHDPLVVDYIAAPPSRDELKTLSILLRGTDQSLVRKYDPLFRELCLDDRFISDNDFWTAIFEHPSLINGPVLATAHQARVCRSGNDVRSFLGIPIPNGAAAKPKEISARIVALVKGEPAPAVRTQAAEKREDRPAPKAQAEKPAAKTAVPSVKAKPKIERPAEAKTKSRPEPKTGAKSKAPARPAKPAPKAKKTAAKPAKAPKRAAKKK